MKRVLKIVGITALLTVWAAFFLFASWLPALTGGECPFVQVGAADDAGVYCTGFGSLLPESLRLPAFLGLLLISSAYGVVDLISARKKRK